MPKLSNKINPPVPLITGFEKYVTSNDESDLNYILCFHAGPFN